MTALAVIAKAPSPGRVKTRLCPPCTPEQAAALAAASLADVLEAAAGASAARRVVVLDGEPDGVVPGGFEVIAQRGGGLDERLANAFADLGEAALIVGMDTPQLTAQHLDEALEKLDAGVQAVLGPAEDGGYWCIGLHDPEPRALIGVPMSTGRTGAAQRQRLRELGIPVEDVRSLLDVDDIDSARRAAAQAPRSRFARTLDEMGLAS